MVKNTAVALGAVIFSGAHAISPAFAPMPIMAPMQALSPADSPMTMSPTEVLLKAADLPEPTECCLPLVDSLVKAFPFQADLIMQLGLIDVFSDFKGTIVMPTEEAFSEAIAALDLDLTMEENIELAKDVLMYHIVPYNIVYEGASDDGSIRVNTKLSDESALAAICEGKPEYSSMIRFGVGFSRIVSGGSEASFVEKDLEFCGPVVVHVIDTVLLPCAL